MYDVWQSLTSAQVVVDVTLLYASWVVNVVLPSGSVTVVARFEASYP